MNKLIIATIILGICFLGIIGVTIYLPFCDYSAEMENLAKKWFIGFAVVVGNFIVFVILLRRNKTVFTCAFSISTITYTVYLFSIAADI